MRPVKFSERIGAVRRVLQKDSMDEALKNALWNVPYVLFWDDYAQRDTQRVGDVEQGRLLIQLWMNHFNQPLDQLGKYFPYALRCVREKYMQNDWASIYDFVEFVATSKEIEHFSGAFIKTCNTTLEKHVSAYRFVGTTLAPITSEEEIAAIEQGMSHAGKFGPVAEHLATALARLADRPSPDCRNSIKESISAVEAACQIITGDSTATLGKALKQIGIHPALEKGFLAIYGYTSDADGIRHALSEEPSLDADDARFFLVSCSAFVNHLIAKSTGSTLSP